MPYTVTGEIFEYTLAGVTKTFTNVPSNVMNLAAILVTAREQDKVSQSDFAIITASSSDSAAVPDATARILGAISPNANDPQWHQKHSAAILFTSFRTKLLQQDLSAPISFTSESCQPGQFAAGTHREPLLHQHRDKTKTDPVIYDFIFKLCMELGGVKFEASKMYDLSELDLTAYVQKVESELEGHHVIASMFGPA
jgi:hypothetical protein